MSKSPSEIAKNIMYKRDHFSKKMGMLITDVGEGTAIVVMTVTADMTNGFGIAHGGVTYSLADSAFAFACNSFGDVGVSIETSISHLTKVEVGDQLTAIASLVHKSRKLGMFEVKIKNQNQILVASFKGTCYYTGKSH